MGCFSIAFWIGFVVRLRLARVLGCLFWFRSASVGLVFGCLWVLVVVGVFFWGRFGFCGCCSGVLLFLGLFLGFGFVSAPRIPLVYWGAFHFFNKIAYYL